MVFKEWLQDEGLDINGGDVTFTYFDNDQGGFEAVKKGEFDLYITNNAQGFVQRGNGIKVVATVKQYAGDYPCCRQNCSEQALHEKYLSLVDFETALLRGYKTYRQEPDTVIPLLVDYSGQEEAYVRAAMYGTDDYDNVMDPSPDSQQERRPQVLRHAEEHRRDRQGHGVLHGRLRGDVDLPHGARYAARARA